MDRDWHPELSYLFEPGFGGILQMDRIYAGGREDTTLV